jgi:hypothetical protein
MRRAPVAPTGYSRAIAPPLTLPFDGSASKTFAQLYITHAKTSLISTGSMSFSVMPALPSTTARIVSMGPSQVDPSTAS